MSGRFVSNELVHTVSRSSHLNWVDWVKILILSFFQVTVDHPQVTTSHPELRSSTNHGGVKSIGSPELKKSMSPLPQQVSLHQFKPVVPAHAKIDHHHVDMHPAQSISDIYMGSGIGGTVQAVGHLSSGASNYSQISISTSIYRINVRDDLNIAFLLWIFAGHTVTIIVMVCAGFLILMISLGVVRVRAARRRAQQEETAADTEMAWDDSALTITVNPMEVNRIHIINP